MRTFQEKGKAMHCYEAACDGFMGSANPAWRHSMHLYNGWEQHSEIVQKDKNNAVKAKRNAIVLIKNIMTKLSPVLFISACIVDLRPW